jgi:hypothetical protein
LAVLDGEAALGKMRGQGPVPRKESFLQDNEHGFGTDGFDFVPLDGDISDDVAMEDSVAPERAEEFAGQLVAVGEDDDVWTAGRLGILWRSGARETGGERDEDGEERGGKGARPEGRVERTTGSACVTERFSHLGKNKPPE